MVTKMNRISEMKTVRDLHRDAIAMKVQGIPAHKIGLKLVDVALASGHVRVAMASEGGGGTPDTVQVTFQDSGDVIYFDGEAWHHKPS